MRLGSPWPLPVVVPDVTAAPRTLDIRYELLDREEAFVGLLDGASGGSIRFDSWGSVRASGEIALVDTGQRVDWLNTRIRPVAVLEAPTGSEPQERPLGVYLASAPVERWSESGRTWTLEIVDKLSIIDQDVMVGPDGRATTHAVPAGTNVIDEVRRIIETVNESAPALSSNSRTTRADYTWEPGTTKLSIINDLLRYSDFTSLRVDPDGRYRTEPYVLPQDRTPVYRLEGVMEDSPRNLLHPQWSLDHDIYEVPNRMIVIGQGDGTSPAMSIAVTNENPDSPFSYQARGRWITVVDTGVEAEDEASLLSYGRRRLTMLTSVSTEITVSHPYLPLLTNDEVVEFSHPQAGVDGLFLVLEMDLPLDPLLRCTSRLERVL